MEKAACVHPKGIRAKVLLSSVFGPFAQDDEYGSRTINPMELYQNQVTRVQGGFSLRMFHRSFGLMLIQTNINAPCTLLDFPSLTRFAQELKQNYYDIIGISAITPNVGKVKKMCELIRQYQPKATIVIGGHISNMGGIHATIDADHIVRGDGIKWFRQFLGQNSNDPVKHPMASSAYGTRILGISLRDEPGDTAAILIPSAGCPVGCNFCSTSALFGGKGKFVNFYETGDELFAVMCRLEKKLKVQSFFVLDENFLLHRKRALRLLELMQANNKSWMLNVFSSARVLRSYSIEQIVGLGIGWVWMGIEGKSAQYQKLKDVDTRALVKLLQSHGIRVLGSSIIGLENHTPATIDQVIDDAVSHQTDFHQFMLYTPNPGTPLYEKYKKDGMLLSEAEFSPADAHGQYRFNYRHKHIRNGREEGFLLKAFRQDFEINGPSLARLTRTMLTGWQRYKNHPNPRIRRRYDREVHPLRSTYAGAVWAMRHYFRHDKRMFGKMDRLLKDIYREFGWKTRIAGLTVGIYAYCSLLKEERRLANGWRYEPACFYEKNAAAVALESAGVTVSYAQYAQNSDYRIPTTPIAEFENCSILHKAKEANKGLGLHLNC
ncbi:MAG: cobalamin B12-binding domain-containing protein [Desulfobacterales bacterium]|uniref:Cobalamin B12-binding domain-containing protein n=1 Tax=Candidatus Desulfatibia vada TaxID=2841696 RepID=A0A8J6NZS6_9BACT|nr:cobalamin B12-binding domain-containing protein [Candidatus Desulfatibia vada]MBL6972614.1 cobalamin-dependent protein [Desulfobacterales bacterium]